VPRHPSRRFGSSGTTENTLTLFALISRSDQMGRGGMKAGQKDEKKA